MIHLRTMTSADLPLGMHLSGQAGWNQTEADWRRFLVLQPDGCFVAEREGRPVGTVATFVFGSVAWIAMVLVEKAERGRGVGTRLVEFILDHLDARGVRSVRLDATDLGRPIYEKLGFVAEFGLARMEGPAWQVDRPIDVEPVSPDMLDAVIELDSQAAGTDRGGLIRQLHRDAPGHLLLSHAGDATDGYVAFRDGARATFVGPAVARSPEAGRDLLDAAVGRVAGQPVYIDIPLDNPAAIAWARSGGLTTQRRFIRMCRGEPVRGRPELLWASSGPEKG